MLNLAARLEGKSQIVVVFGMTIVALGWLISEVSGLTKLEALVKLIGSVAAYSAALVMTLRIAREHRQVRCTAFRRNRQIEDSTIPPEGGTTYLLRIAWLAMAANAEHLYPAACCGNVALEPGCSGLFSKPATGIFASPVDHSRELLLSCWRACDVESL